MGTGVVGASQTIFQYSFRPARIASAAKIIMLSRMHESSFAASNKLITSIAFSFVQSERAIETAQSNAKTETIRRHPTRKADSHRPTRVIAGWVGRSASRQRVGGRSSPGAEIETLVTNEARPMLKHPLIL